MANGLYYIYLMGPEEGPQKIGQSMDPNRRLKQLQAKEGVKLFLTGEWPVPVSKAMAIERYIHWLLRDKLFRSEWFNVTHDEAKAAIEKAVAGVDEFDTYEMMPVLDIGKQAHYDERLFTRYPRGTATRIDRAVGARERSNFIRAAVEAELACREKAK